MTELLLEVNVFETRWGEWSYEIKVHSVLRSQQILRNKQLGWSLGVLDSGINILHDIKR